MPSTDLNPTPSPPTRHRAWHGPAVWISWVLMIGAFNALFMAHPHGRPGDLLLLRMGLATPPFVLFAYVFFRGSGPLRIPALLGIALFVFIALCAFRLI